MASAPSPRIALVVAVLALGPTILFAVTEAGLGGLIASVNVLLIVGSLALALSPIDESVESNGRGH
ncbi:cytochrome-ba3 oxidase subunit [Halovivax limisalsi]|uniref:cytochrome-ba3 oxidase subunit n=1 Tax=Halovivax limisalsi TaxID=1453760 RepID=UPI001FFD2742|nr:cytochrome-ba3 oxidase subunit [Halovivax limisalsi]